MLALAFAVVVIVEAEAEAEVHGVVGSAWFVVVVVG